MGDDKYLRRFRRVKKRQEDPKAFRKTREYYAEASPQDLEIVEDWIKHNPKRAFNNRAYVLGVARQILTRELKTPPSESLSPREYERKGKKYADRILRAVQIYRSMGKGDKPFVKNRLLGAYERHPEFFNYEKVESFLEGGREDKKSGLLSRLKRKTAPTIALILFFLFLIGAIFFLASNFTGYIVFNMTQNSTNFLGAGFFILTVVALFFYFRKK